MTIVGVAGDIAAPQAATPARAWCIMLSYRHTFLHREICKTRTKSAFVRAPSDAASGFGFAFRPQAPGTR